MFFVKLAVLLTVVVLAGCQSNLTPSGDDERPEVQTGIVGNQVGQIAPDFTLESTLNIFHTLTSETGTNDAVVLYFTMWCPVCDEHMGHMRRSYVSQYPGVTFLLIDYVNASVTDARSAQLSSGYGDMLALVDVGWTVKDLYDGTMGTTVVVDRNGIVQMNQDYRDGSKLGQVLGALP